MFLKVHAYSMLLEKITLKSMRIAANMKKLSGPPEQQQSEDFSAAVAPALGSNVSLARSRSFASPARTHDTNTKRNRNIFSGYGFFPQPPILGNSGFGSNARSSFFKFFGVVLHNLSFPSCTLDADLQHPTSPYEPKSSLICLGSIKVFVKKKSK